MHSSSFLASFWGKIPSMDAKRYRIGELCRLTGLTARTIRYYDGLGLLKTKEKTRGGQRIYSDSDLVYIRRIMELKALSFSLDEIRRIIVLGGDDSSGEKRRAVLLESYQKKLDGARRRRDAIEREMGELEWHIAQLEKADGSFKDCPGRLCAECGFKSNCSFRRDD